MGRPIFILSFLAGLLWSVFNWLLWALAGAGGSAVLRIADFLDIEPLSVAWLADTLDAVGSIAQVLVVLVWLIGIAVLMLITWLGGKAAANAEIALREARIAAGDPAVGRSPAVEGVVEARSVDPAPRA